MGEHVGEGPAQRGDRCRHVACSHRGGGGESPESDEWGIAWKMISKISGEGGRANSSGATFF